MHLAIQMGPADIDFERLADAASSVVHTVWLPPRELVDRQHAELTVSTVAYNVTIRKVRHAAAEYRKLAATIASDYDAILEQLADETVLAQLEKLVDDFSRALAETKAWNSDGRWRGLVSATECLPGSQAKELLLATVGLVREALTELELATDELLTLEEDLVDTIHSDQAVADEAQSETHAVVRARLGLDR
jgi:hypothetical protein